MNYQAYAIYDQKAHVFSQPFYAINKEVAGRQFAIVANDPSSLIGKHPADFSLFVLGTFDDELGTFVNLPTPENLGVALNFKE